MDDVNVDKKKTDVIHRKIYLFRICHQLFSVKIKRTVFEINSFEKFCKKKRTTTILVAKERVGFLVMSKVEIEVPDGRRIFKSIALFEQKEPNL